MKNGYDQFFKNARQVASDQAPRKTRLQLDLGSEDAEQQIRRRMNLGSKPVVKRKAKKTSKKIIFVSTVGFLVTLWGFQNHEKVESLLRRIEIQMTGEVMAADAAPAAPQKEKTADEKKAEGEKETPSNHITDASEMDHFKKLSSRKKELDAKEEELNRIESELQLQRADLEKRMKDLEEMRTKISKMLEDRVKADDQKVDTLVQMYSNMKAPQAAKIFETMDEDLAVEILGRMKKKNAADIMNLLKPEKAQAFSEMFAGYKRRTPASQ